MSSQLNCSKNLKRGRFYFIIIVWDSIYTVIKKTQQRYLSVGNNMKGISGAKRKNGGRLKYIGNAPRWILYI